MIAKLNKADYHKCSQGRSKQKIHTASFEKFIDYEKHLVQAGRGIASCDVTVEPFLDTGP
jgi:hypothetical protein